MEKKTEVSQEKIVQSIPMSSLLQTAAALRKAGKFDLAKNIYQKILQAESNNFSAINALAVLHAQANEPEKAETLFQHAIQLRPTNADLFFNLGCLYHSLKQWDKAIETYETGLQLNESHAGSHNNLGNIYKEQEDFERARTHYKKAIEADANHVNSYIGLAAIHFNLGEIKEAEATFRKATTIAPDYPRSHTQLGMMLLLQGQMEEGWREYDWRYKQMEMHRKITQPLWEGKPFRQQTLLITAEQGIGDAIHFIRYLPQVNALGGKVIVECQPSLKALWMAQPYIDTVITMGQPLPEFDIYCPLMRLARIFNTTLDTIPGEVPYIVTPEKLVSQWSKKMGDKDVLFRVGIVWAGNPHYVDDKYRSCTLENFVPLMSVEGVEFFSLQKGSQTAENKQWLLEHGITDLEEELKDFAHTAAVIEQLDLVIAVDTAVAHLAGALNKPLWVLLPYASDWRWLQEDKTTAWYPSAQLFRQPHWKDWDGLFKMVTKSLGKIVKQIPHEQ
ncbi:MAG: tetratricopeptide repeat protein [Gammaproteobacteria bacterium]